MENYSYVVGIDLGTTNTLACYYKNGRRELVKFAGSEILPSVLFVGDDGKINVGQKALNRGATNPKNMIRSSKKFIGDYETNKIWNLNGKKFNPTDVATEILKEVKKNFIKAVGCSQDEKIGAVITVPAYFNNNQRTETRKAGTAAGFNVMWILEEPMAAAIAAVHEEKMNKKVFVMDIGGGTFDLSVLEADEKNHVYNAIALDGDPQLGGDDFDSALVDKFVKIIEDESGRDFSSARAAGLENTEYQKITNLLLKNAQEAKKELSSTEETEIDINEIFYDYDFHLDLSRDDFEDICQNIFDNIFNRTKKFLNKKDNNFKISDIGHIILAGGSCFIPYIENEVEKIFGFAPEHGLDKEKLVAYGAALVARAQNEPESGAVPNIKGIIPHSLGILIEENREQLFSKILLKDTKYPCRNSKEYTTTYDNQTQIDINVYEAGNDDEDKQSIQFHKLYGSLQIDIAPMPKGVPTIEVIFDYDNNQKLTVTAVDKKTGDSETVVIESGQKIELPQSSPIDLMLLLDISGSMSHYAVSEAKKASLRLVKDMIDLSVHRMGVVSFESSAKVVCRLTHKVGDINKALNSFSESYGSTNMTEALRMAYSELEKSTNDRFVLMMTDGCPDYREETLNYAHHLRSKGVKIYVVGVGGGVDFPFLEKMAGDENVLNVDTIEKLTDAFKDIMGMITPK